MKRASVLKALWVLPLTLVLYGIWNWPVLLSAGRPLAISVLSRGSSASSFHYNGDEWKFYYPRLGIEAPVTQSPNTSPMDTADWGQISTALTKGVSLNYVGDSLDQASLAYLTGHSSDTYPHAYSAIFAGLGQAEKGDEFVLTGEGGVRKYRVIALQVIEPHNTAGFSQAQLTGNGQGRYVALVTCWPLLTTANRKVVVGEYIGG